jgi:NAD-specific glutamate dehydrogenase
LRALTERFSSANSTKKQAAQNVHEWLSIHEQLSLAALNRIISEAQASGQVDLATILVATRYLANMAEKATKN